MDPSAPPQPSTSYQVPAGGLPRHDFSQLKGSLFSQPANLMSERDFEHLLAVSKIQSEGKVQYMKRLMEVCYAKCSARKFKEGDLLLGEGLCIDRCVSKYHQVKNLVGESSMGPVPWEITGDENIVELSKRTTMPSPEHAS